MATMRQFAASLVACIPYQRPFCRRGRQRPWSNALHPALLRVSLLRSHLTIPLKGPRLAPPLTTSSKSQPFPLLTIESRHPTLHQLASRLTQHEDPPPKLSKPPLSQTHAHPAAHGHETLSGTVRVHLAPNGVDFPRGLLLDPRISSAGLSFYYGDFPWVAGLLVVLSIGGMVAIAYAYRALQSSFALSGWHQETPPRWSIDDRRKECAPIKSAVQYQNTGSRRGP